MGESCKADPGGGRRGGEDDVGGWGGDDRVSDREYSEMSSGSLCSSWSSLTDGDDAESSPVVGDGTLSSSSSSLDSGRLDGDGGGPLYELSTLLSHLPVRTGLSKYYQGRSQSFASLSDAKCLEDLAKKTTPYISRMKACRGYAAAGRGMNRSSSILRKVPGPCSKTISKKTTPRGSSDVLLSRARSRGLLHRSRKPPAYQSKKELCSTYAS